MKKLKSMVAIGAAFLLMTACSVVTPLAATSNTIGKKQGEAKATAVFGLCFGGDYGVQTAARNGGITKISTVDVQIKNILNVVIIHKTIVTGE